MNTPLSMVRPSRPGASSVSLVGAARWLASLVCVIGSLSALPAQTPPPPSELLEDHVIVAVFEDLLGREPSRRELREWRSRSEGMTVADLQDEIMHSREYRSLTPEMIVTDAFRDLLEREPDPEAMRLYRRRIIDRGWTAGDVREAIRGSDEYRLIEIDLIIDRAFDDLLERAPTAEDRQEYRRRLLKDGTEDGIRRNLKKSEEYKYTIPRGKITRAYQEILGREPDAQGLENYRKRMINEGWSEDRVRDALFKSPEYRNRNKPKKP